MSTGTIYLLCFVDSDGRHVKLADHAGHYLGWAIDLPARLDDHRSGCGAKIMRAACQDHGFDFVVARLWRGTRALERRLKNQKCAPKLCPRCNPGNKRTTRMQKGHA